MNIANYPWARWQALTEAINLMPAAPGLLQRLLFRDRRSRAAETIRGEVVKGGAYKYPFVRQDQAGKVVTNLGREEINITPPTLRVKKQLSAGALLLDRAPGAVYVPGGGGDINASRERTIASEQADLKRGCELTIEWMCAQALSGALTVSQDDLTLSVDYGVPAGNKKTLTGDLRWGQADADVPGNIEAWTDEIADAEAPVDLMLLGVGAAKAFAGDANVLAELDRRNVNVGELTIRAGVQYMGNYKGLEVYKYPFRFESKSGVKTRLLGENLAIFASTSSRFSIEFGMIADLKAGASVQAEYFSKAWEVDDPSGLWLLAESHPLPMIWEPGRLCVATVA